MKLETLLLKSLFAACLLLCLGVMSAMVITPVTATPLATAPAPVASGTALPG